MKILLSKPTFTRRLRRILAAAISIALVTASVSTQNISAYYTVGASGRSLEAVSGLVPNKDYIAVLGSSCRSGQLLSGFSGVTIHETSNWSSGATARMHALYLLGAGQNYEVSWHYSVDSTSIYQSIPETEKAWHAGDTENGVGNSSTIAIEICDNSSGNFDQAMANTEWLAADILFRHNVHSVAGALFQHHDFSTFGKNCPITIRDSGRWTEFCTKTQTYLDRMIASAHPESTPRVVCQGSVQTVGWQGQVSYGAVCGTTGQSKGLEAISLNLANVDGGIEYRSNVQGTGWQDWVPGGSVSGTTGESKSLEAIEIRLTGTASDNYDIYYRAYSENYGWMGWTQNGQPAGTEGLSYKMEAVQITLVPKGGAAPGDTVRSFINQANPGVSYQCSVQRLGWLGAVRDGAQSGTTGQSKRLEAMIINLANIDGGIEYRTHIQDIGWMDWVQGGAVSGTTGQSKRMEAIEIRLTGAAADQYDIYYRVHAQNNGWLGWAQNGESAGTAGFSYRVEAVQVILAAKGSAAPGTTENHFVKNDTPTVSCQGSIQDIGWQNAVINGALCGTTGQSKRMEALKLSVANIDGGIEYRTHVQDIGWMDWVSNGAVSGTTGQSKRLEALAIRLTGAAAEKYDVYYRIHAQNRGWLDWASNGQPAGTAGFSYRVEALQVVLVPKGGAAPGATALPFVQA